MNYEELAKKTEEQQEELDQLRRNLNEAMQAILAMQKDNAPQAPAGAAQFVAPTPIRERWTPPKGKYVISMTRFIRNQEQNLFDEVFAGKGGSLASSDVIGESYVRAGLTRDTLEKANYDAAEMLQHNLLLAYRAQFAPDYVVPTQGTEAWYVRPGENEREGRAAISSSRRRVYGLVYFPRSTAQSLADKINSGEVVL